MDLHLGLSLSTSSFYTTPNFTAGKRKLTSFSDDDNQLIQSQTLPLFLFTNSPNEEDRDESRDSDHSSSSSVNQIDEEEEDDGIVGWPPIKFRRRKIRQDQRVENGCNDCQSRLSNSKYVKVKMEGVAIARKINLASFNSFQHLQQILISMFGTSESSRSYKLIYQDREGDWLLADNVSWRRFIESAQRLKLVKNI